MKRKLSTMERIFWVTAPFICTNFALVARVKGALSLDQLKAALAKVQQKHPLLNIRAVVEAGQPHFVSDGVPALSVRIVERHDNDDWKGVVEEELDGPFRWDVGPLARFVWLRSEHMSDLVLVCDHAIGDGLAALYLLRDILLCLGNPTAPVTPLPEPGVLHDMIPPSIKSHPAVALKVSLIRFMLSLFPSILFSRKPTDQIVQAHQVPYCLLWWDLNEAQTSALIARCQEKGVSVHAALCVAFLLACAETRGGERVRRISCPVNVRSRLSEPIGEIFGPFFLMAEASLDCLPGRDFWELGRDLEKKLSQATADKNIFTLLLAANPFLEKRAEQDLIGLWHKQKVRYDLSLSNLGRLNFPLEYGPLRLEAIYGPAVNGNLMEQVLGVITVAGRMSFTFTYRDSVMDASTAENIRDHALQRLGEAAGV